MNYNRDDHKPWKGLLAGLAAGAVASFVMSQFQEFMADGKDREQAHGAQSLQPSGGNNRRHSPGDDAERLAHQTARHILKRRLNQRKKPRAPAIIHYAYGTVMGGAYGLTAEYQRRPSLRGGMAFGSGVWAFGDEVAVPILGLSGSLKDYPFSTHVRAFGSHVVYGLTTELVRRSLRRVL